MPTWLQVGQTYAGRDPWNPASGNSSDAPGLVACPAGAECLALMDFRFQGQNYDNIGAAMSVILQFMTLKGWVQQMLRVQSGFSPVMIFFFLSMLVAGPLYMVLMFQVVLIKTLSDLRAADQKRQLLLLDAQRKNVALSVMYTTWADITVYAAVLARNPKMRRYLRANGCDFRFRSYVQVRRSYTHWHGFCASVIMGEKPTATAALHAAQQELDKDASALARMSRSDTLVVEGEEGVLGQQGKRKKRAGKRRKKSWLRKLAMSKRLETGVSGIILLNTMTMMMGMDRKSFPGEAWQSDRDFTYYLASLEFLNTVFTFIFTTECLIKLVGMGRDAIHGDHLFWPGAPLAYFRNGFNIFDFLVVILTGLQVPDSISLVQCYLENIGEGKACESANAGVRYARKEPYVTRKGDRHHRKETCYLLTFVLPSASCACSASPASCASCALSRKCSGRYPPTLVPRTPCPAPRALASDATHLCWPTSLFVASHFSLTYLILDRER
jgi:hypothetical protein